MKRILLTGALFLAGCANIPNSGNPVQQPFSWVTFCTVDVPFAKIGVSIYETFATVSAKDANAIASLFTQIDAMCLMGPNNTADAQTRASAMLAGVNNIVKNPNQGPAPNVIPLK
jgi:hypothetical protein